MCKPKLNITMKKLFLLFVCASTFAAAQAQVQFGAKAGLNLASISGEDKPDDMSMKLGLNIGVFADISVAETFSVKPELVYSSQGYKIAGEDGSMRGVLSYINLPVLAKYNDPSGFFAETGPQAGFLASAKSKYDGNSSDMKDNFKSIDFAWAFGIGYQLPDNNIGFNARYNLGLSSIPENGAKAKNSVIQVGVFYVFGGK